MTCPRRCEQDKHAFNGHSIIVLHCTSRSDLGGMTADCILHGMVPVAQVCRAGGTSRSACRRWKLCRRQMLSWQRRRKL